MFARSGLMADNQQVAEEKNSLLLQDPFGG